MNGKTMHLEGVLGQPRVVRQLEGELNAGRLAHAYVFVGPKGVGRSTTAKALFLALNCVSPEDGAPCGACLTCRRMAAGAHEDFLVLAPPSGSASAQIKVEEVRQVIRTMSFSPFAGGWRMVLIKEAGHLNPTSANVLLKTLEEPPPKNVLVLTVEDAAELLPTLVSRCRRVNFQPLEEALVAQELIRRQVEPDAARLKAAMSTGSLGRALELEEEQLGDDLKSLLEHLANPAGPLEDWAFAEQTVAAFRGGEFIDRRGLAEALGLWALYFRDQAVAAAGREGTALLPLPRGAGQKALDSSAAAEGFVRVRRAQSLILQNASPELAVTVLLQELAGLGGQGG